MSIASSAIATRSIAAGAGHTGQVAVQCVFPWSNVRVETASVQSWSIRLNAASEQRYDNERLLIQHEQPYGPWMVHAGHDQRWEACVIVRSSDLQPYGNLLVQAVASYPYGNAPVCLWNEQPIRHTVETTLAMGWSVLAGVHVRSLQPWGSTTPVAAQCAFSWDRLERNPVSASSRQIWNLSDDRSVRLAGNVIRAFHFGELV
ncbi:MAG: hypothetical protein HQL84_17255 [Magnetococcales bacterium]|nr:hypothetical protein [Magnetococcales bacterium]MBF0631099.1 hypothetical protein [Magnetococcales bacterium]